MCAMETNIENDKCACCGNDTGVPKDTPVTERKNYIRGSGQLCEKCYVALYSHEADDNNIATIDEMHKLIR